MKFLKDGNWGLKLLALILAIILYHAMKTETGSVANRNSDERQFFQYRR